MCAMIQSEGSPSGVFREQLAQNLVEVSTEVLALSSSVRDTILTAVRIGAKNLVILKGYSGSCVISLGS